MSQQIVAILLIILLISLFYAVLNLGFLAEKLYPRESIQVGDAVEIFLDGVYNRTATITGVTADKIYIYDTLPLPLDYRGKFYAIGYDIDGVEFWYLKDRKRNYMVQVAEFLRIRYHRLSDPYQLEPVTSENDILTAAQKQKTESENIQKKEESEK